MVHDRGYLIAASPGGGTFAFYRPDGSPLPACPPLPEPDGSIDTAHDADITPDTIIPPWYGERLDLNHAIWACFANARTREERERDPDGAAAGAASRSTNPKTATNATASTSNAPPGIPAPP